MSRAFFTPVLADWALRPLLVLVRPIGF